MKRLQFDISEERVQELDDLVERTGLKTRAHLFNSALTLFEWAIREREAGRIIAAVDEKTDKYKEIQMPGFPNKKGDGLTVAEDIWSAFEQAYTQVMQQANQSKASRQKLAQVLARVNGPASNMLPAEKGANAPAVRSAASRLGSVASKSRRKADN
jgi:hypothetical protein